MHRRSRRQAETPNEDEAKHAREEAQRQNDERARAQEAQRRRLLSHFRMWTICPGKACGRARACRGDVQRCMSERWHVVIPAETKALLHKASEMMADGVPAKEAVRLATEDIARHKAAAEAYAQRETERAPPPLPDPPVVVRRSRSSRGFPGPRIWSI
jgi:hypothetical protein